MKTSKAAPQSSPQAECGVWLDTVQLKAKVKQKHPPRPISKLLNPLAEGYSLAVALNFTQTKMEMPKTKQSTISTFFSPKQRVLHKPSSIEAPNPDSFLPPPVSIATEPSTVSSVRKRTREICFDNTDSEECDAGVCWDLEKENVAQTESTTWQNERNTSSALLKCDSVEGKPPQCKRRLQEVSSYNNQTSQQPWSQDPLLTCSEEYVCSGSSFLGVQNSEHFGNLIDVEGKTSTQKPVENSFRIKEEKENSRLVSLKSPSKQTLSHFGTLSNHKRAEEKNASPQKQPLQSGNNRVKDAHFDSLWRKPRSSPLKKMLKCREADEESLASLFTQDSEGFRVIAHRGLQTRSPLKDQSNLGTGSVRSYASKPLMKKEEEDEEDEMLFTQDSQGNMVIKH
ncbi:PREDICTED: aurora kinase A and ninein-interacting protein-like [Cyprinodon variegatus]|uniref:aurora kinase A and ninein-interacting protein-like n=1 Tax=Cyprinodon variegatus TaxID=28743 RepID=UPI000742AD4F|nr:PREDICTED: aurora kinase A and ninein-interacting protein-like [Cyprinodon variegatus]